MSKTKIIAMYLPQFHCIPENDKFWGKGFTDWVTVKNAKPLFKGHNQPRVPLNNNYYDLSQEENVVWQAKLAKEYGIYGFGVYHYWFNNEKNLLTKPAEIIRDNKDVDINYFLAWDNLSWRRTWSNLSGNSWADTCEGNEKSGPSTLIEYVLGTEPDWENHYNYVRTHFLSDKYIKVDNKPIFIIFYYNSEIEKMCQYWNKLAQNDGFNGVHFIFKRSEKGRFIKATAQPKGIYTFNYEPMFNGWQNCSLWERIKNRLMPSTTRQNMVLRIFDYDQVWNKLLQTAKRRCKDNHIYHGAFVSYDDTPRRGEKRGIIIKGDTPEKFYNYMKQLIEISNLQKKEFIFLTAWNEWGEGACLEPDACIGHSYLNVIKRLTKEN